MLGNWPRHECHNFSPRASSRRLIVSLTETVTSLGRDHKRQGLRCDKFVELKDFTRTRLAYLAAPYPGDGAFLTPLRHLDVKRHGVIVIMEFQDINIDDLRNRTEVPEDITEAEAGPDSFAALFEQPRRPKISRSGKSWMVVLSITKDYVVVDIGYKAEGQIATSSRTQKV